MIHPCIDIANGKVVQLVQGERMALVFDDYRPHLELFAPFPLIHVIDLDAAKSEGSNNDLIAAVIRERPCRVGGGIRSVESAQRWIDQGAEQVILGSALFRDGLLDQNFVASLVKTVPVERLIFALDIRDGSIATHGWRQRADVTVEQAMAMLGEACAGFLVTLVNREGLMEGTDCGTFLNLRALTPNNLIAAGGITTLDEVRTLNQSRVAAAIGMCVYTGKLSLDDLVHLLHEDQDDSLHPSSTS